MNAIILALLANFNVGADTAHTYYEETGAVIAVSEDSNGNTTVKEVTLVAQN